MSNRRRPQHRDAHGPIRTPREILVAILVGVGVVVATAIAIWAICSARPTCASASPKRRGSSPSESVSTPSTSMRASCTTLRSDAFIGSRACSLPVSFARSAMETANSASAWRRAARYPETSTCSRAVPVPQWRCMTARESSSMAVIVAPWGPMSSPRPSPSMETVMSSSSMTLVAVPS